MIAKQFEPMALGKNRPQNAPAGFLRANSARGTLSRVGALDMRYCLCVRSEAAISSGGPFLLAVLRDSTGTFVAGER
jgi:hypothetical protein